MNSRPNERRTGANERLNSVKRPWRKILAIGAGGLAFAACALVATVVIRENRRFDAPFPEIRASTAPEVIERGRYIVNGPGHCADCHGAPERHADMYAGASVPLSGGFEFDIPVGVFRVPNITSDRETGIGRRTDRELARLLRYGVAPDGRAVLPFMPFADLSDEDLTAVISYLRSLEPVKHRVSEHEPNLLGRVVKAFVIEPKGPTAPVRKTVPRTVNAEYGRYLAHNVANCVGCHSPIDMRTGELAGPIFAGGDVHASLADPTKKFIAPNLTPDPRWGWIANWDEATFVARIKAGRVFADSPMPWQAFARMSEDDLRAIYRYLRTLPGASGGPDPLKREVVVATTR